MFEDIVHSPSAQGAHHADHQDRPRIHHLARQFSIKRFLLDEREDRAKVLEEDVNERSTEVGTG
jgi:hypothetical protein